MLWVGPQLEMQLRVEWIMRALTSSMESSIDEFIAKWADRR